MCECVGGWGYGLSSLSLGEKSSAGGQEADCHMKGRDLFLLPGSRLECRLLNNTQVVVYVVQILRTINPHGK